MSSGDSEQPPRVDARLDVLGLFCPEPIVRLQDFVQGRAVDEVIEILADDGGIQWDLPAWCISNGHSMLRLTEQEQEAGGRIWVGYVRLSGGP